MSLAPGLFKLCGNEMEFAQMVGIAQGMMALVIVEVRVPMVMNRCAGENAQNPAASMAS